ncbi:hypothetical protein [Streptomyces sp. LN785]|uniref:hypothetical protein n=1 Tax=Streptomyces sp. LN785 TaxID=3112983 RepID=UPI0037127E4A
MDSLFALRTVAAEADTPHLPAPCRTDLVGSLAVAPPATEVEEWLVSSSRGVSHPVATLRLEFPMEEEASTVSVPHLAVRPDLRRMGIGRRVTEFAWARARLRDRRRVLFAAEAGTDSGLLPAHHLARIIGARPAMLFDHHRLDVRLAPPPAVVPADYTMRFWGNAVPEGLLAEAARLDATLSPEVPAGGVGRTPRTASVLRVRGLEQMRIARGRRAYQAGVWHVPTSRLVAWSAVSMTSSDSEHGLQAVTVVDPAHRLLGFERLVRAYNLASVRASEAAFRTLDVWYDADDVQLRRVNEEFGFRSVGTRYLWELPV